MAALESVAERGPPPERITRRLAAEPPPPVRAVAWFVGLRVRDERGEALPGFDRDGRRRRRRRGRDARDHQPGRRADRRDGGAAVRVTIAEDSALLRAGIAALLADEGHQVVAAVGDAKALSPTCGCRRRTPTRASWRRWPSAAGGRRSACSSSPSTWKRRHAVEFKDRVAQVGEFLDALERVGSARGGVRSRGGAAAACPRGARRPAVAAMAEGLTNAGRLRMSVSAAEKHVASIFGKLELAETEGYSRRVLAILRYRGRVQRQCSTRR